MIKKCATSLLLLLFVIPLSAQEKSKKTVIDRSATEIVNNKCQLCHGKNGEGSSSIYPRLAGQNKEYIAKQLMDFRSGRRVSIMNEMAADLTNEEIFTLAEYFNAQLTLSHRIRDKKFAAVGEYIFFKGNQYSGIEACASCHGEDAAGTKLLPRLAGQHKRYVSTQLEEFNSRKRNNDNAIMHSIASKLTELEREAVALYVSGLK